MVIPIVGTTEGVQNFIEGCRVDYQSLVGKLARAPLPNERAAGIEPKSVFTPNALFSSMGGFKYPWYYSKAYKIH